MKLKCDAEDFRVEEQTTLVPSGGPFALYRLWKRGLGTPEAVEAVLQRWGLARQSVSYGGLKDRHAVTVQHLTIHRGPRHGLKQTNLEMAYLGQCAEPFDSKDIAANRFTLVLRDLSSKKAAQMPPFVASIAHAGVPNYFDHQRFGSLGASGEFAARPWCLGDYQRALWLIMADPNPHDRSRERRQRDLIREHWGDWARLRREIGRSTWTPVVSFLAEYPEDFRRAIAQVRPDLRSIYLAALQSYLWNQLLAATIRHECPTDQLGEIAFPGGALPFYRELTDAALGLLRDKQLRLPSARVHDLQGTDKELLDGVLECFGLPLEKLRVKYPRDSFFSKGTRAAIVFPTGLESRIDPDDRFSGRSKITLKFDLPRGAYATILTRCLAAVSR